jgi:hypothetical protein
LNDLEPIKVAFPHFQLILTLRTDCEDIETGNISAVTNSFTKILSSNVPSRPQKDQAMPHPILHRQQLWPILLHHPSNLLVLGVEGKSRKRKVSWKMREEEEKQREKQAHKEAEVITRKLAAERKTVQHAAAREVSARLTKEK